LLVVTDLVVAASAALGQTLTDPGPAFGK